ncbi:hypothetical protein EDB19DRAFT_1181083 [Suillus lakei]|nr:hypothetical protein EDB19DRAFT_1181083 [Suillus lakei]
MPNQLCHVVHLSLNRTFLKGVFFIRAHSKHVNCVDFDGQKLFVGEYVVVDTIIHGDPLRRHQVTLGIEAQFFVQCVDSRYIRDEFVRTDRGHTLVTYVIAIGQLFWAMLLRKLDKPFLRDAISVELQMRLPFRTDKSERSIFGGMSGLLWRRGRDLMTIREKRNGGTRNLLVVRQTISIGKKTCS